MQENNSINRDPDWNITDGIPPSLVVVDMFLSKAV